ncbi:MAG: AtpZ/AtpI family protein [Rhizobiaceae bacterium]|nr:AtpZ/AtpI family protein [Rhizobiaceae bacterium]
MNKRLGRDVQNEEKKANSASDRNGFGNAFKLSSEFISAILVGAILGYGIDWLVGTKPWAMILFLLLGFVAGVLNVLRASGELSGGYDLKASQQNDPEDKT